jgi:RNA polymerase sigma-70 factor (ECF subfamily)
LAQRHTAGIRRLLYGLFNGNREDMEDAEQEIFLALFQTLPSFKGKSSFKTFLYRLCRNKAIDMLRKKGREKRILRFCTDFSDTGNPEAIVMKRESGREILKHFRELNREERTLLILKDVEGLSIKELGRIMEVPIGTVKSRLHRTREKMADRLGGISEWNSIAGA